MATNPRSTSPVSTASSTSGMVRYSTCSAEARSGWVFSACSVNVPSGPRKPTRVLGAGGGHGRARLFPPARPSSHRTFAGHNGRPMDERELTELIEGVRDGTRRARRRGGACCAGCPFTEVGDTLVDHHRALRQGMPEAVYGQGKSAEQCIEIVGELLAHGSGPVLLTRVIARHRGRRAGGAPRRRGEGGLRAVAPSAPVPHGQGAGGQRRHRRRARGRRVRRHPARLRVPARSPHRRRRRRAAPAAGATSTASPRPTRSSWWPAWRARSPAWSAASPSAPVVAVPTSVGHGAGLDGITALLAMHASCASGVTVVGIDNGFGAACAIARMCP